MPDLVSLATLRSRVQARMEIPTTYVSNGTLDAWINSAIKELVEEVLSETQAFWVKLSDPIAITSGTSRYPLPSDFLIDRLVEVQNDSATDWRALFPTPLANRADESLYTTSFRLTAQYYIMNNEILLTPTPTWSGNIRVWYNHRPETLVNDSDEFDFVNGWDRFIIGEVGRELALMQDTDPTPWIQDRERRLQQILRRASSRTTRGGSKRVIDTRNQRRRAVFPYGTS